MPHYNKKTSFYLLVFTLVFTFLFFETEPILAATPAETIDAATAAKAVSDAETAKYNAAKAASEAELAALKAKTGDSPAAYDGTAKVNTNAGKAESMLLGAMAVDSVAGTFAKAIIDKKPAKVLLVASDNIPAFRSVNLFNAQYKFFEAAKEKLKPFVKKGKKGASLNPDMASAPVAVASFALEGVTKILSYAKTDYEFFDVSNNSDNQMLVSALAKKLLSKDSTVTVKIPAMFQPNTLAGSDDILNKIKMLYNWAGEAKNQVKNYTGATTEDDKKNLADWTAFSTALVAWLDKQGASDAAGGSPFGLLMYEAATQKDLDTDKAYMVVVKLNNIGGTAYTKKNLWSSLGANPFYVMGSVVASYTMFDRDGNVISSQLLPWHGGYHSVSSVQEIINKE